MDQTVQLTVSAGPAGRRHRAARASLAFLGLLAAAALAGVVLLTVALVDEPSGGRAVFLVMGILVATGFTSLAYIAWRVEREAAAAAVAGSLEITDDSMVLDHPAVFTDAITFRARDLRAVAVDSRPLNLVGLHWHRFPVREGDQAVGCLWRRNLPSPVAIAAAGREAPNVVVVFREARRFPTATGAGHVADIALAGSHGEAPDAHLIAGLPGAPPVDPQSAHGALFLSVDDPDMARHALRGWAVYSDPLRVGDVGAGHPLLPLPGAARTAAGAAVWIYLAVATGLLTASLGGLTEVGLWAPLAVPPAAALDGYVIYRGTRTLRLGFSTQSVRQKLVAVAGLVLAVAVGVAGIVGVAVEGGPQDDVDTRIPTVPSVPAIPPIPPIPTPPRPVAPLPTFAPPDRAG